MSFSWFYTSQTGGQQYTDTSRFSVPWKSKPLNQFQFNMEQLKIMTQEWFSGMSDRQTDRQTEKQTDRQAEKQADWEADRQRDRQAVKQTGRQAERQTGRWADWRTGRQAGKQRQQTSRESVMNFRTQTDRRTIREIAKRQTEKQTHWPPINQLRQRWGGSWSKGQLVEGHFVDLLLLVAVVRLYASWSTIHRPKRGVLVHSKSAARIELALMGAEIFTFKVVTSNAYLTLSLPWLMTCWDWSDFQSLYNVVTASANAFCLG